MFPNLNLITLGQKGVNICQIVDSCWKIGKSPPVCLSPDYSSKKCRGRKFAAEALHKKKSQTTKRDILAQFQNFQVQVSRQPLWLEWCLRRVVYRYYGSSITGGWYSKHWLRHQLWSLTVTGRVCAQGGENRPSWYQGLPPFFLMYIGQHGLAITLVNKGIVPTRVGNRIVAINEPTYLTKISK